MNPKYRYLYLSVGAVGFALLFYKIISDLPEIDPVRILCISIPDMVFFFLAYKTYPADVEVKNTSQHGYDQRKVTDY
jgi:hypothetical protein